jgi:hypothetical protein
VTDMGNEKLPDNTSMNLMIYTGSFNNLQNLMDRIFRGDKDKISADEIIQTTESFMINADKYIKSLKKELEEAQKKAQ